MSTTQYYEIFKQYAADLFAIDSPTGYTDCAAEYICEEVAKLGFECHKNRIGNVIATVPGEKDDAPVALSAHIDTLGLVVRSITSDGQLMLSALGAPILPTLDGEYCNVYTMDGKKYTGTILSLSPAIHVFPDASSRPRDDANMAVRLDELVYTKEDVEKLGIAPGDFVCYDPKTTFTEAGFLKTRFIDDKACAALELTAMKYYHDTNTKPAQKTYFCFSTHEEIGYGGATIPSDIHEFLVVDMGCVGLDLSCNEEQVSICSKDSGMVYDYEMTRRLVNLCKENKIDYARDIYPRYTSDGLAAVRAGLDIKCALIGPGVCASHGMERTHKNGLMGTFELILAYLR